MNNTMRVAILIILPTLVTYAELVVPSSAENLVELDKANIEVLNKEVRKTLLTTIFEEFGLIKNAMETLRPNLQKCQAKTYRLMGSCMRCVDRLCENRFKECQGIAKVLVPNSGGVSISSSNINGRTSVTVCSVLPGESNSCQTIMNPDGVVVQSITNMGNSLQVNLRGAVNDLGGNVGTFVNGMQTIIGNYQPSELSTTVNQEEFKRIMSTLNQQYQQIARNLRQEVQNIGAVMNQGMNRFASNMEQGMSNLRQGISQFGQQPRNMFINEGTSATVNKFDMTTNALSGSNGFTIPLRGYPANNMRNLDVPVEVSKTGSNGDMNSFNAFGQLTTPGIPDVVNVNSMVLQGWNQPMHIQSSLGNQISENVNRFTSSLQQQIASMFNGMFGKRKKRAATQEPGGVPVRHTTIRNPLPDTKVQPVQKKSTLFKPQITTQITAKAGGIPIKDSHIPKAYISRWTNVPEESMPTLKSTNTTTTVKLPKYTPTTTAKPRISTKFNQLKILKVKKLKSGSFSVEEQASDRNLEKIRSKIVSGTTTPITSHGDLNTPKPDCGTILIDSSSCKSYRSRCSVCAKYIDGKKGDIMKRVCGPDLISKVSELREKLKKVTEIQQQVIATQEIIQKIEYDSNNIQQSSFSLSSVYVSVKIKGKPFLFKSKTSIRLLDMKGTGKELSDQIWKYYVGEKLL